MLKQFVKRVLKNRAAKKQQNVQYYDNYTMLGSILGGYCGLLKFGGK